MKRTVIDALRRLQTDFGVCVVGYVIMPEHVHVLIYPHARGSDTPTPISKLLHAFKQHVGHHGKQVLRAYWKDHGRLWSDPLTRWAHGEFDKRFIWNKRGHDFNIFEQKSLIRKLDYCHKNPVIRGLVEQPEQWSWSPGAPGPILRIRRSLRARHGLGRKLARYLVSASRFGTNRQPTPGGDGPPALPCYLSGI